MIKVKFYFEYSSLLGTLNPIIEKGYDLTDVKKHLLNTLNSMLDHDGKEPKDKIESIVKIKKIEYL